MLRTMVADCLVVQMEKGLLVGVQRRIAKAGIDSVRIEPLMTLGRHAYFILQDASPSLIFAGAL